MSTSESVTLTRPTERTEGEEIEPTPVKCWACGARGALDRDVGRCHQCGRWCEVVDEEGGERP